MNLWSVWQVKYTVSPPRHRNSQGHLLLKFYMKVGSFFFLIILAFLSFLTSQHTKKMWGAQHISCLTRHVCHVRPPVQDIITVLPGAIWPAWWCAVEVAVAALHLVNLSPVWDRRRRVASRWCFLAWLIGPTLHGQTKSLYVQVTQWVAPFLCSCALRIAPALL
jgi:hypothetical protein